MNAKVNHIEPPQEVKEILQSHAAVFTEELECLKGQQVHLHVQENASPKFCKARRAAPIVPVVESDGSVRICGDFKATINQVAVNESYPLPRVEELFANLSGGKRFTKLDLANAYLQLPLDEASKEYVTINTHRGLFRYNRLPFGLSSAPAIFQRCMETVLQGLKGVSVYIDDIILTGASDEEHRGTLDKVLERLELAGLRLRTEKCFFMQPRVVYLGHVIDEQGLHPTEDKVKAIRDAPSPKNVTPFLG